MNINFKHTVYSISNDCLLKSSHYCLVALLYFTGDCNEASENVGISSVVVAVIVIFIVSVTATAIITFIVAYVCVKRTLTKTNNIFHAHNPSESSQQEKVLYEQVISCIQSPHC